MRQVRTIWQAVTEMANFTISNRFFSNISERVCPNAMLGCQRQTTEEKRRARD